MSTKKPNLREALEPARKSVKEAGERASKALGPARQAAAQIREGLGLTRSKPFEISRVSDNGKKNTDAGDPAFATLAEAVAWAVPESQRTIAVRFDIMKKTTEGVWTTVKQVFRGQVSDPA